jgi:Isocitrate lyase family
VAFITPNEDLGHRGVLYCLARLADGDTGYSRLTAVLKLAKLFAENGAAAVHFKDQLHGGKKCGHLAGKGLSLDNISNMESWDCARLALVVLEDLSKDSLMDSTGYEVLESFHFYSLATQFLCVGFVSYIQAYIGPFNPFFLDTA